MMHGKRFKVDARAVVSLGRDSIKDHVTAVVELVKNSYDAGATVVDIVIRLKSGSDDEGYIRVCDDGQGMSETDVEGKWLRIGYSEKLEKRKVGGRRMLGEKGVGRLSADRLGSGLRLKSQAEKASPVGIVVDWEEFEKAGRNIEDVEIGVLDEVAFKVPRPSPWLVKNRQFGDRPEAVSNGPSVTGTELKITRLRQQWIADDVVRLRDELGQLLNPFEKMTGFQIRLRNDVDPSLDGVLLTPELLDGEIEGTFIFSAEDVTIRTQSGLQKQRKKISKPETIPLPDFLGETGRKEDPAESIGPVSIKIRLYSIGDTDASRTTKSIVTDFLTLNAGVRVYRDGIRVLPYGDKNKPDGDWLELAQRKAGGRAAVTRRDWRIEPSRIVAGVFISRDANPSLRDASGREGLIGNGAFSVLRDMALAAVRHLELAYHELRSSRHAAKEAVSQPRKVVKYFKNYVKELGEDLKDLEKNLPKSQRKEVERVRAKIERQEKKAAELGQSLGEILDRNLTYRGLATLGIAHASYGHEIQMSAGQFVDAAEAARLELNPPPDLEAAAEELEKAIRHGQRISTWGSYTLTRVKAAKRVATQQSVGGMMVKLVSDLAPFFSSSSIALSCTVVDEVDDKLVPMDLESLVINLVTNAYDWTKDSERAPRKVVLSLRKASRERVAGYEIAVADTGPGVPKHIRENIWLPLFTTKKGSDKKPSGTGLGLSIVEDIVKDLGGHREVGTDKKLRGALFTVWLPNHTPQ